jgi:phage terminase small subunit
MQRGPKKKSIEEKKAVGSYRPCRDDPNILIPASAAPPEMPDYLTADAQEVWHEELDRVTQSGTSNLDSSLFADYCCLAAIVRAAFKAGEVPKGNQLVELRKQRELLGIGGAPSRAQRGKVAEPDPRNEFAKLLGE